MSTSTDKKHIAMYIGSLQKGGAEHVMVNLAEYFWTQGYHVTLVTTYISDNEYDVPHAAWKVLSGEQKDLSADSQDNVAKYFGDEQYDRSDVVYATVVDKPGQKRKVALSSGITGGIDRVFTDIDSSGMGRVKAFKARFNILKDTWKKIQPDLILSFIGKNNIMAIMTAKSLKIPVVVSVRAKFEMEYPSKSMMLAMKYTFPKAAGIVLQSKGAAACLPDRIRKKTIVLPNSINPDFIRQPFDGTRDKVIVSVGRVDANKNHKLIIDSFNKVIEKYPEYRLVIYGDGPDRDKLTKYVSDNGLGDKVTFMGSVPDVADRIQNASMFILASDMEGMPNALIEAMSLGLPCITTDCMYDTSELIQDNINGIVVPKGDERAMADAMKKLLAAPEYANKLGFEASKIQEDVAPDIINMKWDNYFQSIMNK